MELRLQFGPYVVGVAKGAFCSDSTWYAEFHPASDIPARVRDFISFCEDWHKRLRADQHCSAIEFDKWADIHSSLDWRAYSSDGQSREIEGPVFVEGEVTWREPGREPDLRP